MAERYLRNKKDGFIYPWHPTLAKNPLCEEVTEEQAFPERFVRTEQVERVRLSRAARQARELALATANVPEPP
ncbi:hypothetical protein V6O07_02425, partial [Arthrospira platensis SPKY2]